jgi:hypothetical protein
MRIIVGLVGLLTVVIGVGFLIRPDIMGAAFFVAPTALQGMATLRGDFPGFFIGASVFALAGAWRADPVPLIVPTVLLAIVLAGRVFSIIVDGIGPDTFPPMVAEALMIAVLVIARGTFRARSA